MVVMRRRDFIKVVASAVAPWPLPLRAQQATKVYRIGYLGVTTRAEYAREIEALLRGLHQLGYEEGKNIAIDYRFAEGDYTMRLSAHPAGRPRSSHAFPPGAAMLFHQVGLREKYLFGHQQPCWMDAHAGRCSWRRPVSST